jgi:hypothetical protein
MQFAVSKGEKDLSELVSRLFGIKGRSSAAAKNAEAALLKANPHLTQISKIPEGTLIVIPNLPGGPLAKAPQTAGIGVLLEAQAKSALQELADVISRSATNEEQAASATQETLKSRELKELAAHSPEVKAQIDKIAEAAKNQSKNARTAASAEKEALSQLQATLEKFAF